MKTTAILISLLVVVLLAPQLMAADEPLRALGMPHEVRIGASASAPAMRNDATYVATLAREFGVTTPEDAMKFWTLHPARDRYNFTDADMIVDFAQANGMQVRGHTLVWHLALPTWITQSGFNRDELITILHEHIQTVVGRYRGRVAAWDVVNEAFNADGSLRNSFWLQNIGPEYVEMAFRWAHEADPQALLFYNDYNNEVANAREDAIYRMAQDFVNRGVPIHGVGFQMHLSVTHPPSRDAVVTAMERLAQLGLQAHITELDVKIQNGTGTMEELLNAQAQVYRDMLSACLEVTNCPVFMTWGVTDLYSWIPQTTGRPDAPLLFDTAYQPKPAYFALVELLAPIAPDPSGPAIRVDITAVQGQTQVLFQLFNVAEVYGLEARCSANPAAISGINPIEGDGFNSANSFFVDQGFNATDGSWVIAASRLQPNPAISGNMLAFGLAYTAGDPAVNCSLLAVDTDGNPLPLEVINGISSPVRSSSQTAVMPAVNLSQPTTTSTISGALAYQNRPDNAGITVQLLADESVLAEAATATDGTYQLTGVPLGTFVLEAHAPQHLPVRYPVVVAADGQMVALASGVLPSGDTDDSGSIDILDATLIGANFGVQTPPAPANADLNRDSIVNISDLVLVGVNFGLSGPVIMGS